MGKLISTRRSRLRSIQSALAQYSSGWPLLANHDIRVCSRKRPTTERTVMLSEMPATPGRNAQAPRTINRSEEHTSELQSLMRNPYAVFCLKTQKQQT